MAVYTHLTNSDMQAMVSAYDIGRLERATGIAEGVENSNYLLETTSGKYIFTVFEKRVDTDALPFYLGLMEHLAEKGIDCPSPVADRQGAYTQTVTGGKKAAIVTFLHGKSIVPAEASTDQLRQVGGLAASLQLAGRDFPMKRANELSLAGWRKLYEKTALQADSVQEGLSQAIGEELHHLMQAWPVAILPSGAVHADLFPDNIFFKSGNISGVIDFYFACNDAWAYDLAITMNAWCFDARHRFDKTKAAALLAGYEAVRPLTQAEHKHLPTLLRGAALRFLLTRLHDQLFPVEDAVVTAKDPLEYLAKLQHFQMASLEGELL